MPRVLLAFEPPDGGVAENVLQLATGLGQHGWEVELAGPEESLIYPRVGAGTPIHRLPYARGYGRPDRDWASFRGLSRLLRRGGYDLVHCHSAKAGVVGRLAAKRAGVPAVYSPHCLPFVGEFGAPRRIFATAIERALAPLTARMICVAEDERRRALAAGLGPADRLPVVHNGCESCDGAIAPDPALRELANGGPVAAAVAVMRRQKRLDVLIDAAPEVLRRVPDASLAVVGDGPLREELHAQARALGLDREPRFAFLPFSAPAARHLRAADVYVLPSGWEALPIGVLEALACGVPQVATDVGGTGEAIAPETGVLVPPSDPAALADALAGLLADAGRRQAMAAASARRHAEHFTVDRMVADTAAVYAEVRQ
jgi:glycosyltransferase involved in cell wall biosynthesis